MVQAFVWRERKLAASALAAASAETSLDSSELEPAEPPPALAVPKDLVRGLFAEDHSAVAVAASAMSGADGAAALFWKEEDVAAAREHRISLSLEQMLTQIDERVSIIHQPPLPPPSLPSPPPTEGDSTEGSTGECSASGTGRSDELQTTADRLGSADQALDDDSEEEEEEDSEDCYGGDAGRGDDDDGSLRVTLSQLESVAPTEVASGRQVDRYFTKDNWVPNSAAAECMQCAQRFSFFVRRHHCRRCGELLCASCSCNRVLIVDSGSKKPQRVCKRCLKSLVEILT